MQQHGIETFSFTFPIQRPISIATSVLQLNASTAGMSKIFDMMKKNKKNVFTLVYL